MTTSAKAKVREVTKYAIYDIAEKSLIRTHHHGAFVDYVDLRSPVNALSFWSSKREAEKAIPLLEEELYEEEDESEEDLKDEKKGLERSVVELESELVFLKSVTPTNPKARKTLTEKISQTVNAINADKQDIKSVESDLARIQKKNAKHKVHFKVVEVKIIIR